MRVKIGLFAFWFFISNSVFAHAKTFTLKNDTLSVNAKNCPEFLKNDHYYRYKRLYISNAYKIIDSAKVINRNELTVLILSPIDQEVDGYEFPCNISANRILLIYNAMAKYDKCVVSISDNVVFNKFDFSSDSYSYNKNGKAFKNGFNLYFNMGSATKCNLTLFFVLKHEKFYLRKYTTYYYSNHFPRSKSKTFYLKADKHSELNEIKPKRYLHFPNW